MSTAIDLTNPEVVERAELAEAHADKTLVMNKVEWTIIILINFVILPILTVLSC